MNARWVAVLAAFAIGIMAIMASAPALAADPRFPALSGRVVDEARLLRPETERRIEAQLEKLATDTGRQVVVATIADLQGHEIEDYGYRLGRHWGIGRRQAQDGIVLLVAPRERRVRIEVGYGLEPIMTDALSAQIIHDQILPSFRTGGFEAGLQRGVDAIDAQIRLDPALAEARADAAVRPTAAIPLGPAIMVLLVFVFVFLGALRAAEGHRRDIRWRRPGGSSPVRLWRGHPARGAGRRDGETRGFRPGGGGFGGGGASGGW